jgi:uncharacterized protein (DUF1697 family)
MHIALLRAINVGGKNVVAMSALRSLFEELGLPGVRTLLQSGNVVFDGGALGTDLLEDTLEQATAKRLGVRVDFVVRTASDHSGAIAANPFTEEARQDPTHLLLMSLKAAPAKSAVDALRSAIRGPERVAVVERCAYLVYPEGIGRSKLTSAAIERKLGVRGTARNWTTVQKLAALAGA